MPGPKDAIVGITALETETAALGAASQDAALKVSGVSSTFGELARTLGPLIGGGYVASQFDNLTRGLKDSRTAAGAFTGILLQAKDASDKLNREVGQLNANLGATTYSAKTYVAQLHQMRMAYGEAGAQMAKQLIERFAEAGVQGVTANNLKVATAIAMSGGEVQQAYMSVYEPMYRQLGLSLEQINSKFFVMEKVARSTGLPVGDVTRNIVDLATRMRSFGWTINDAIQSYGPYADALKKQKVDLREVSADIESSFRRFMGGGVADTVRNMSILQRGFTDLPAAAQRSLESVSRTSFGKGFQQLAPAELTEFAQVYGQQYGYNRLQAALVASQVGSAGGGVSGSATMDQRMRAEVLLGMSASDLTESFRLLQNIDWSSDLKAFVGDEKKITEERTRFYDTEANRQKRHLEDLMSRFKGLSDRVAATGADLHTTSRVLTEFQLALGLGGSGLLSTIGIGPGGAKTGGGIVGALGSLESNLAWRRKQGVVNLSGGEMYGDTAVEAAVKESKPFAKLVGARPGAAGAIQSVAVIAMSWEVGQMIGRILDPIIEQTQKSLDAVLAGPKGAEGQYLHGQETPSFLSKRTFGRAGQLILDHVLLGGVLGLSKYAAYGVTGGPGAMVREGRASVSGYSTDYFDEQLARGWFGKGGRSLPKFTGPLGRPIEITINVEGITQGVAKLDEKAENAVTKFSVNASPWLQQQ